MRKSFADKCKGLEKKGWKLISSIFFGGWAYVTYEKGNRKMEVCSNNGAFSKAYFV
jgi:hypothetical protein